MKHFSKFSLVGVLSAVLLFACHAPVKAQEKATEQDAKQLSVKEFRSLPTNDTTCYVISGTVEKIRDQKWCNFYLKDDTGSVLVFGMKTSHGHPLTQTDIELGLGDQITVRGRKSIYDKVVVEMKNAVLISHVKAPKKKSSKRN